MKRKQDVSDLIRQAPPAPAEQAALDRVAARLEETLGAEPPARPEFRADLRARLVAEARRLMDPTAAGRSAGAASAVRDRPQWQPAVKAGQRASQAPRADGGRRSDPRSSAAPAGRRAPWVRLSAWGLGTAAAAALAVAVVWNILPQAPVGPAPDLGTPPAATASGAGEPVGPAPAPTPAPPPDTSPPDMTDSPVSPADEPVVRDKPGDQSAWPCPWCLGAAGAARAVETGRQLPPSAIMPADGGLAAPADALASGKLAPATVQVALTSTVAVPEEVRVYRVHLGAADVYRRLALALDLSVPPVVNLADPGPPLVSPDACRSLALKPAGVMEYQDTCAGEAAVEPVPAEVAASRARQFLQLGGAPLPTHVTPEVRTAVHGPWDNAQFAEWQASSLDGYPVVGPVATVVLAPNGQVAYARLQPVAFEAGEKARLRAPEVAALDLDGIALPGEEAYQIILTAAELVYGYPADTLATEEERMAQPFWRLTGTTAEGYAFVGYAPALFGAHLQEAGAISGP